MQLVRRKGTAAHGAPGEVSGLSLCRLNKRQQRADLIAVFKNMVGCYRKDRARLFVEAHSKKLRGNGNKLQQRKFYLDIKNRGPEMEILKI